ncbi:MAG: hypothetical protein AB8B88_06415 [Devosiaceae bacterium]
MTKTPVTHGYSGKPLYQKLGLKPGMRCLPINPPDHYASLVEGAEGVTFLTEPGQADLVHLFCADRATLDQHHAPAFRHCATGGMVWISWPKKSSKIFRDLTEDDLRAVLLPTGWVDVKVCAVDQDWSGLKFLRRKS